jgi:Holliday junction resolvase-like predicted endonuclease
VDAAKQHQITKAARFFLSRYGVPQPAARFDVVAVVWPDGRKPHIRHTTNAFDATF